MKCNKMNSITYGGYVLNDLKETLEKEGLKELPKIQAHSVVKLHGTNSGVKYDIKSGELSPQSKNRYITPQSDNYGFANWFENEKEAISELLKENILSKIDIKAECPFDDFEASEITIFGEWAGKKVQRTVAVSELEKTFFIFGIRVSNASFDADDKTSFYWISPLTLKDLVFDSDELRIYNLVKHSITPFEINLNNLLETLENMNKLVDDVEKNDPLVEKIAKRLDIELKSTIGEGVIIWFQFNKIWANFKAKGKLHTKVEPKKLINVDNDVKLKIAEQVTPAWRMQQGIQEVFGENWEKELNVKKLGVVIKWVMDDVEKEDLKILEDENLALRDINRGIAKRVREYFFAVESDLQSV